MQKKEDNMHGPHSFISQLEPRGHRSFSVLPPRHGRLRHRYQCSYLVYNFTSCTSSALPRIPRPFFLLHPSLVTFGLEDHNESFIVRDVKNQPAQGLFHALFLFLSTHISIGSGEDLVCSSFISKPLIMQFYCASSFNVISFDGGS